MTSTQKLKAAPAVDEIDEIMNEIEELQASMSSAQATTSARPAPKLKVAPAPAPLPTPAPEASDESGAMDEFRGGGGDVSMEETLANLKDDEPSGPNLIDQAMEAEAHAKQAEENGQGADEAQSTLEDTEAAVEEPHVAEPVEAQGDQPADELLDEAEAEALNDAIDEEEQAVMKDTDSHEEEQVYESPRRKRRDSGRSDGPSVAMRLTGEMMLRLSYEFESQEVRISFSDGALRVELSDGTEFKIPVRRSNSLRKAA